jgi:hypothetical protein
LNSEKMITKLNRFIRLNYKSVAEYARSKGVLPQYVHNVLNGSVTPKQDILDDLGLQKEVKRVVSYVKRTKTAD